MIFQGLENHAAVFPRLGEKSAGLSKPRGNTAFTFQSLEGLHGELGDVASDNEGTGHTARIHWANKATKHISDLLPMAFQITLDNRRPAA